MKFRHISGLSLLTLIVAAAPLCAQGVSTQLAGRVLDKQSAPVAGATVVIRNQETGFLRTVLTDAGGRYVATALPVGPYAVTVTKAGFQAASNVKVTLNLGDAAPLTIRLAPEASAVVEVVADTSKVDSDRASAAAFISPDNLDNLPVLGRNFTNLATLAPQVVVDSSRGNLAIAGQRGVNTSINIDGADDNEPFFGGAQGAAEGKTPFTISIEAIREYQVVTDGASAEFGRMGGGYVNAITKNGTNDFTGSLFYYKRPSSMQAAGPTIIQPNGKVTTNPVGSYKLEQFGFSAGGPIIPDKLFYFVAYDAQRQTNPIHQVWGGLYPVTLDPATYSNDAVLAAKGGDYTSKGDSDTVFARFDWNINTDHTLQFRINHSKYTGDTGSGTTAASENRASDDVTTDSYLLQWNWVINANWLNEARISLNKDGMPRSTYVTTPEVSISHVGYYGAYPYDRQYNTKRTEFQENLSYVTPTLQVKGGIDYNSIDVSEFFAGNWQGVYFFNSLNDFRAGKWSTYRQNFGITQDVHQAGLFSTSYKQEAAFVQADWRPVDTVKLGLGLRWDRQENPDYPILNMSNPLATPMPLTGKIPSDSEFSPRFSFTWTPSFDKDRTVVRGSAGRYVSTTPSVFFYQVYAANAIRTGSVDFKPAQAATYGIPIGSSFNASNPYYLNSTLNGLGGTPPKASIWTFNPDFKNPYTDRVNIGVERPFFRDLVLGLSATYAKGNRLERTGDLNIGAPTGTSAQGRILYGPRPNSSYYTEGMYSSDATSLYHAYTFSLKYHKDGSNLDAQLYYTYAINKDSDSNERNYSGISIQDYNNLAAQWGYADTDRRNVITGYVSYLDKRFTGILASLSLRYQSGTPYTLLYSYRDMNKDGNNNNDRYFVNGQDTGRNTQRAGSLTSLDLGLRRDIPIVRKVKLTLSVDVFNLLNRQDTYLSQQVASSSSDTNPQLNQAYSWIYNPRQVQWGARLSF